ncbi:MAG: hypothetical protein LKCHEGNO_03555 [Burkholderiaceae bacterium]|nr:hypothetical protein [Burkholderiaceae bacterium]
MRTRRYCPGSNKPCGLGTSARSITWPDVGSTDRSVNSSLPGRGSSLPSSSSTRTSAPCPLGSLRNWLASSIRRSRSTSALGCVKLTYTLPICWIVASSVASAALTSAPSVTTARPMCPAIGALTRA